MDLLSRCEKLMKMTESPNVHEAAVANTKLQEFIEKHGIKTLPNYEQTYKRINIYV